MLRRLAILVPLLTACASGGIDLDNDGFTSDVDCNDQDPDIFPGANERCDGVDQDCDGYIDEAAIDAQAWYLDEDRDGVGAGSPIPRCGEVETGWSDARGDCDDNDPDVFPGAPELCDERDQDCDNEIDEDYVCGEVQCDDEVDDDLDGLIDCDDPDCDGACPETCDDARDNDDNGAIDCADEVCWDAPHCVETDCTDDIDDEQDGLTDCDDPDCWTQGCPDALWRVTAGSLSASRDTTVWTEKDCEPPNCESGVDRIQEVQTYAVTGELLRRLDGEWHTCAWSYDRGRFAETLLSGTLSQSIATRDGFVIADGCGVADSRFLPRRLVVVGDALHVTDGRPWFWGDRFEDSERFSDLEDPDRSGKVTRDLAFWDPLRPASKPLGYCTDGAPTTGFADVDLDGMGGIGLGIATCDLGPLEEIAEDCDDGNDALPAAFETCANGGDDDCDGGAPACPGPGGISLVGEATLRWDTPDDVGVARLFSLGDLDGDGAPDLGLGLPRDQTAGVDSGAVMLSTARGEVWFTGANPGDVAGASVINAGDQTGDGLDDLLVTATGVSFGGQPRSGAAYLLPAPLTGGSLGDATTVIRGDGDWLGSAAVNLGDVNSDGWDDLAVGAQTDDLGGTNAGAIYIFTGPLSGALTPSDAAWTLTGRRNDIVGDAVAAPGDVDGDGVPDLLVGRRKADGQDSEAGEAHLILAPYADMSLQAADATWTGHATDAWAGERVAGAGDVNDDGYADLLVAAPRTWGVAPRVNAATGEVYLILGGRAPVSGSLRSADAVIRGDRIYDFAGADLAGGSDLDGDGVDDFAIGAPGDDRGGRQGGTIAVFTSPILGQVRMADADGLYRGDEGMQVGSWVVLPGDLDGDGIDDLLSAGLRGNGSPDGSLVAWPGGPGW